MKNHESGVTLKWAIPNKNRVMYTGNVFTVRHHRDDQACVDTVGFIKGLHKHNILRSEDVIRSRGRLLQDRVQQHFADLIFTELLKAFSRDRIHQRFVEQFLLTVLKSLSQDRVQQRNVELISVLVRKGLSQD